MSNGGRWENRGGNITFMRIDANSKTIRILFSNAKYRLDYYQREYSWQTKHVSELINDLTDSFSDNYNEEHQRTQVPNYRHYFLGSIIISDSDGKKYIVDGQQRFTTLTLLLIRLFHLLTDQAEKKRVEPLIYSLSAGIDGFNLDVEEWKAIFSILYPEDNREVTPFDIENKPESIQNLFLHYKYIEDNIEFQGQQLLYFVDWLLENVYLVEIVAFNTRDAYAIFETVNDRGLSLTPSDMLRGYLLSKCGDNVMRERASNVWSDSVKPLKEIGRNEEAEALKAWLRSQHAQNVNDFDEIGSEFHRWVESRSKDLNLDLPSDFYTFIERDFKFYSKWYRRLRSAANSLSTAIDDELQCVYYNAQHNKFTLQYPLLLATLNSDDSEIENLRKIRIAAEYLDILIYRRIWNSLSIAQNTMANLIPQIIPDIRGKNSTELVNILSTWVQEKSPSFSNNPNFRMQKSGNRHKIFLILARITDYVGVQSHESTHYSDYMRTGNNRFEIEHIWAENYDYSDDQFNDRSEFEEYREHIGGLLLLPKTVNASIGNATYTEKRKVYAGQNLLAKSLHENAYINNPRFHRFIKESSLPFKEHKEFKRADLDKRQDLYTKLAEQVWNLDRLKVEMNIDNGSTEILDILNAAGSDWDYDIELITLPLLTQEEEDSATIHIEKAGNLRQIRNEIQGFYKTASQPIVDEIYNRIEELKQAIEKHGWSDLTFKTRKLYCGFYFGNNPIFGVFISKHPQFVVWMDAEDVEPLKKLCDFKYISSRRQAIYPQLTPVKELYSTFEFTFKKHCG